VGERSAGADWGRSRPVSRGGSSRPPSRRDGRREPVRGVGERSGYARPRRPLPARLTRPPVVAVERAPQEPLQGVHADESPANDLIWGRHPAQAALESGRPVHRIWCTAEMRFSPAFLQLLREAKASGVLVEEVTWARLGQITGGAVHQGIVLQAAAAETLDLTSLIEGCRVLGEPPLLMALDGITDPHNLGAIARSAEALGAHGLVLPQRRSAGLTGSVAKVAAGALEHLPVARVVNLNRALDSLKQEGYRVVGLAAEGSASLEQADLDGPLVIVTGSEGDGLSMLTRKHCDQLISIPLRGATPSLNASVATALLLYEVARRSWMKGLSGGDPAPRIVRPQLPSTAAAALADPSEAAVQPDSAEPLPTSEPVAEAEPDFVQPEPDLEPQLEQELELDPELELEMELELELELELEPVPGPGDDPGADSVAEAEDGADLVAEAELAAEAELGADSGAKAEPEADPLAEADPQPTLDPPIPAAFELGIQPPHATGFVADVQL